MRACIEALGGTVWEECLDDDDQVCVCSTIDDDEGKYVLYSSADSWL